MAIKLPKAAMPFCSSSHAFFTWCGKAARSEKTAGLLENWMARDPHETSWSSFGLVAPIDEGRPVHDLDGRARMLVFQFNDRILPAAVRDEKLKARIAEVAAKQGHKVSKKDVAKIKEDVEAELLPHAFIRRSLVPVLVYPSYVVFCTSSAKKMEACCGALLRLAEVRKIEWNLQSGFKTVDTCSWLIGELSRVFEAEVDNDANVSLLSGTSGVFKGEDKRTIRVKDREMSHVEVQAVVNGGYKAIELGVQLYTDGEVPVTFTLTDSFVIKAIKSTTKATSSDALDVHNSYWLFAATLQQVIDSIIEALNVRPAKDDGADEDEF